MPPLLLTFLIYAIPLILLALPFIIICHYLIGTKSQSTDNTPPITTEPNLKELEQKLSQLIKNNALENKDISLQNELKETPSHIIAAYLKIDKNKLKGYHLFQLIFSLIKNRAEDGKIIKILKHTFPSCATSHLIAMLKSFKAFLNILPADDKAKKLLRDLNQNRLRSTLLYLENKINNALNKVQDYPPALQQPQINEAVKYGLIFAAFSEFYDSAATEKILRLANALSPELFLYWHQVPKEHTAFTRTNYLSHSRIQ